MCFMIICNNQLFFRYKIGRNIAKTCDICHKSMRGDVLKKHMK